MRRLGQIRYPVLAATLLALAVGASAAVFTVLRALSASGLPYPDADRIVVLRVGGPSWSPAMLEAVTASSTAFDAITGIQERAATLTGDDAPAEIVRLESVSASYFHLLGLHPAAGRVFGPEEDRRNGTSAVAVISDGLWRRRFAGDVAVLGRRLVIDGRSLEVIGVMAHDVVGLIGRTDVWTPLGSARWLSGDTGPERPSSRWFEVIARRRPAVSLDEAGARFDVEGRTAISQTPGGDQIVGANTRLRVIPLAVARVPNIFPSAARILTIAVAAILLLVIVNVTSLHVARLEERRPELAVRLALGAGVRHIARLAFREAAVIATFATAGAILLRPWFLTALSIIQPPVTSFGIVTSRLLTPESFTLDMLTFGAVIATALAGTLPLAIGTLLKARGLDLERAFRDGTAATAGLRRGWTLRTSVVAVQAALACAVIGGGILLMRGTTELLSRDRGYRFDGITTARIDLEGYDSARASVFYNEVIAQLLRVPGITSASVSSCAPGGGRCRLSNVSRIDGQDLAHTLKPTVGITFTTSRHFETIGAQLAGGRSFTDADGPGTPLVAIVSAPLASQLWPGLNPIGRSLEVFTASGVLDGARTVVGIVNPIAYNLADDPGLDVFLPAAQAAWTTGIVFAAGQGSHVDRAEAIARIVTSADRSIPVSDVGGLDVPLERSLSVESFLRTTLLAFGLTGLVLAALGMYAVVAHVVAGSRREIGIRIALGATPRQIGSLVARRGLVVGGMSAAAGAAGAGAAGGLLTSFLYGLSPMDPIAVSTGPVVTLLVIVAAVGWPAVRASRTSAGAAMRTGA